MARIRRASIYIKGRKVGVAGNNSLSFNNNTDRQHGTDGIVGGTDGNPEYDLEFDHVVTETWDGAQQMILDAIDNQEEVTLVYQMGVKTKQGLYKCQSGRFSSEPQRGTMTGNTRWINTGEVKTA